MTKGTESNGKEVEGRVVNFDHLIFWVANAKTASSYFVTRFGFKPLAVREATEDRPVVSYAVRINKTRYKSKFWCVDYKHDLVPYSCINSGSVINKDETVLLSLNEAAKGLRPTSKASDYVKALGTSGVEHVALYTDDIVATLKASPLNVTESLEALQENGILIDFDERGYMLQAFTKHVQVRPTVFIEIIQRRNHRGFGSQNYKWVFEAIELLDKTNEDK
ncbi:4-hydroxyphenylpyruvate dioxygenase [Operophtera brumata]|uniref:4-hydroxyphenylpyruvate dioxygenase n=1 Tax=Operophtera brumata TaxID=104452 RepID=A0A0L7KJD7_OPEBR|nr:4-hydroxyphenylpyruvate dioxygenase [Operophtera brumata]